MLGRLRPGAQWRRALTAGLALVAVALAGLGLAPALPIALVLALAGGGGMVVGEIFSDTALPRMVDETVLARAYGLAYPASIAGIAAGALIAGPLVALVGVSAALLVTGAFVAVAGATLVSGPLRAAAPADLAGTSA